jgi:hypothetical protein
MFLRFLKFSRLLTFLLRFLTFFLELLIFLLRFLRFLSSYFLCFFCVLIEILLLDEILQLFLLF